MHATNFDLNFVKKNHGTYTTLTTLSDKVMLAINDGEMVLGVF